MPDIFSRDCDYISEEEYMTCHECYRYELCKKCYETNKNEYIISTGIDGLTSAIPKNATVAK